MKRNPPAMAFLQFVNVGGEQRPFVLYAENERARNPVVIVTADSICFEVLNGNTSDNRYTKMGDVNGLNGVAKSIGGVAVHLLYKRRFGGLISGPNVRGGMLPFDPSYDDIAYLQAVMDKINQRFGTGRKVFVGFSAGSQYGLIALSRMQDVFTDFVSVSGTMLGTEGEVHPGVNLVRFYGARDERFPWEGGLSKSRVNRWIMRRMLEPFAADSKPQALETVFAQVNSYRLDACDEKVLAKGIARKQYNPPGDSPTVVSYFAYGLGLGGHTYHGRERVESLPSRLGAPPAAKDVYSVNEIFVRELGLSR
jgi:hypothetical protein